MNKKKIAAIKEIYDHQKALRNKSDELRYEAFSYLEHRTKELSAADDVPFDSIRLYSAEGKKAVETFVHGVMSAFMSPTQRWFGLTIKPRVYRQGMDVLQDFDWCSYAERAIMSEFQRSNLYSEANIASYDSIIGGYSCMGVQENPVEGRTFFQTYVPWRCYFDRDVYRNWDLFIYEYTLTGYEMLERFPDMSEKMKDKCKRERSSGRHSILYVICDRKKVFDEDGNSVKFAKNMKFASLHIALEDNEILEESGFNDFPVSIHIWEESSDSQYGVGLVMKYISEFRKLNRVGYEEGLSIAKINHSGWLLPESMIDTFSDDPEARNIYTSPDMLPIQMQEKQDLSKVTEVVVRQEQKISRYAFNDLMTFLMNHEQVYTATQVNEIKSESLSQIAPLAGNIENQKIIPILKLTLINMLNNGRVEYPKSIAERDENNNPKNKFEFTLESAMAKQLRAYTDSNAVSYMLDLTAALTNSIGENGMAIASRRFNFDNMVKMAAIAGGASAELLYSDAEVERMEQEAAAAQQKAMELEMAKTQSEINRNNAGAANLNNIAGNNGGAQ